MCDGTTEMVCSILEESYGFKAGCDNCTRINGDQKLDTSNVSWYKKDVENNISHSNSTSTSKKEEIIMTGQTDKKEENKKDETQADATFGQKFKATVNEVKGPAGWLLFGMALLGGVQLGTKAYKEHKAKQTEQAAM